MSYYENDVITCEVCGHDSSVCECPECPLCREVGNPDCFGKFGHLNVEAPINHTHFDECADYLSQVKDQ